MREISCAVAALLLAVPASAQPYPDRPVRIVTAEAGGSQDVAARILAVGLTAALGQQFIIDNRSSGVIPGEIVSRAKPDGHTLLIYAGTFWMQPLVRKSVPYDPVRDFAPISLIIASPTVLVVHPALPAKSVKELIALAKSRPGELNFAMGSVGAANHLAAELFKSMAGVDMLGIGYRGNGSAVNALVSGQVQLMFATASSVTPLVRIGRLRALAVASAQPSPLAPDLPTIASAGLPGYESQSTTGFFAPAKTPPALIEKMSRAIAEAVADPEVVQKLVSQGGGAVGSSPKAFGEFLKNESSRWLALAKEVNISAD